MKCPRCARPWPMTYDDPTVWDCPTCVAAATQYTRDAREREEAAPPAPQDVRGQSFIPGTETTAPPLNLPGRPSSKKRAADAAPTLFPIR